jgi:ssDNA-binding Zn-finger/Zn-ribbon topoisomerase 1
MPERPSRDDPVTIPCPRCGQRFVAVGRQRYCSAACRQAGWRQRHPTPLPLLPTRGPRVATVYECVECGTRYLGEQRCPDCQRFCRRLGPGGACPHCEEPVALADLLPGAASLAGPAPAGRR